MVLETLRDAAADVDHVLIDRQRIAQRVAELARAIHDDLEAVDDAVEIVILPVLTGAFVFVSDLIRHLPQKVRVDVTAASSYAGPTTVANGDPLLGALPNGLDNRHVVIVDDILDSGTTIRRIRAAVEQRKPRSVHTCVLLRKDIAAARTTPCEYVGFEIPDEFVVGYGLDYNGYYRNLPDIGVLKQAAL